MSNRSKGNAFELKIKKYLEETNKRAYGVLVKKLGLKK